MISVKNLEAGYGSLKVLRGVSIHVNKGEIVALVGANGAGKSTLLNSISGLVKVTGGSIELEGKSLTGLSPEKIVHNGCAQVPEGRQVFAPISVDENLTLGGYVPYSRGERETVAAVRDRMMEIFPILKARLTQYAGTLSGGEQQMLAMARALLSRPKVLMLDEPSMGLAPLMVKEIFNIIVKLREEGCTILLVEQNAKAALRVADRAYVLETGHIALEGNANDLLRNRDVQRAYLGKEYKAIND
ncbi:MAG: ABC transporter ATP-binding protein [Fibrobacteres bacterium]|nr:ABC transporter ATP-binding protein [Fibrobacterota bacterium]